MKTEIWKDIKDYEGLYRVSNLGRIKSLKFGKERILKVTLNSIGYVSVNLSKYGKRKSITAHQLVAMAFLNHKPCGHKIVVDHIDNNKENDKLYNLQLISNRENTIKDTKRGSSKYVGVSWHKNINKWRAGIYIKGKIKHLGYFTDEKEAAQAYKNELKKIK